MASNRKIYAEIFAFVGILLYLCWVKGNTKQKNTTMQAALKSVLQPQMATISDEKWNSLHTIEELDSALKAIIHRHFHAE